MSNVVFFSFKEADREIVLTIKGRAVNPRYSNLNFRVRDLLRRWRTEDSAVIKQAISKSLREPMINSVLRVCSAQTGASTATAVAF